MSIKKTIQNFWFKFIIRTLVEKIPFLKTVLAWVDGKKTAIGRLGVLVSLILAAVQFSFPDLPHINEINAYYMMIISWVFEQIGVQHRIDKEQREKLFTEEILEIDEKK